MIKYKIKTGDKVVNMKAQGIRDHAYKPALKGMHCRSCSQDTEIEFLADAQGHPYAVIHACCSNFKQRVTDTVKNYGK